MGCMLIQVRNFICAFVDGEEVNRSDLESMNRPSDQAVCSEFAFWQQNFSSLSRYPDKDVASEKEKKKFT